MAPALTALYRDVRGIERPVDWWRWVTTDTAAGGDLIAVDDGAGAVLAVYGQLHMPYGTADGPRRFGSLHSLAIRPQHRGWSLLRDLFAAALEAADDAGIACGFAFATGEATEMNARLGWPVLGRLPAVAAALRPSRALRGRGVPLALAALAAPADLALAPWRAALGRRHRGADLCAIDRFDDATDDLWRACATGRRLSLRRDAAWLNWRYVDAPHTAYARVGAWRGNRLDGVAIWRPRPDRGDGALLELFARDDDPSVLDALARRALASLCAAGAGVVVASFPRGSAEAHTLARRGFLPWATRLFAVDLVVFDDTHHVGTARPAHLDFDAWSTTMGDWLFY